MAAAYAIFAAKPLLRIGSGAMFLPNLQNLTLFEFCVVRLFALFVNQPNFKGVRSIHATRTLFQVSGIIIQFIAV